MKDAANPRCTDQDNPDALWLIEDDVERSRLSRCFDLKRNKMKSMKVLLCGTVSMGLSMAVMGCSNETEADRAAARASMHMNGAALIGEGQKDVDDGKAMMARGQSMKDHGDNAAGEDTMQRGQVKVDQGNSKIQHGRDLGNK